MIITEIEIISCKYIPEGRYEFGSITKITGKNGAGKSSLVKAALLALTGLGTNLTHDPDALGDCEYFILFSDNSLLHRKRDSGKTVLKIDDIVCTQEQVTAKLCKTSAKIFALMFWPGLFYNLGQADRRKFLQAITPEIDLQKIADEHFEGIKLPDNYNEKTHNQIIKGLKDRLFKTEVDLKTQKNIMGDSKDFVLAHCKDWYQRDLKLQQQAQAHNAACEKRNKLRAELENAPELIAARDLVLSTDSDLVALNYSLHNNKAQHKQVLEESEQLSPNCPTCKRPWTDFAARKQAQETKASTLAENITRITKGMEDLSQKQAAARKTIDSFAKSIPPKLEKMYCAERVDTVEEMYKKHMEKVAFNIEDNKAKIIALEALCNVLCAQIEATDIRTGVLGLAMEKKLSAVNVPNFSFVFTDSGLDIYRENPKAPVDSLSSGEKIRFCIALSKMLLANQKPALYSIFIEQADLLDGLQRIADVQLICEKVVSKQELKTEVLV